MKKFLTFIFCGLLVICLTSCSFIIPFATTTNTTNNVSETTTINGAIVTTTVTTDSITTIPPSTNTPTTISPTTVPTTISTVTTTTTKVEAVLLLESDFGEFNSSHSNYGEAFTENIPNGSNDSNPSGSTSYTLKGANTNNSSWAYTKFGKKNTSATLSGLENYVQTETAISNVSEIVLSLSNVAFNTTIVVQSSEDKASWTTEKEYLIENDISSQDEITITGLDIKAAYIRVVFTNSSTAGDGNGWLLYLYTISFYSGKTTGAPKLSLSVSYPDNKTDINTGDSFTLPTVSANDKEDGDISANIITNVSEISAYLVSGTTYEMTTPGSYTISFTISDSDDNTAIYTLIINVNDAIVGDIDWSTIAYYSALNNSADIITDLAKLLRQTIIYVSYGDARYVYVVDQTSGKQYVLYNTGTTEYPLQWSSAVNREHIWPCNDMRILVNLGSGSTYGGVTYNGLNNRPDNGSKGHYSDLHNLWLSVPNENSSHSSHFFGGTTTSWTDNTLDGPDCTNSIYYPGEEYCGDVARACFYMTLMYPYLTLVNEGNSHGEGDVYYGYLNLMLEWNEKDPVSAEEIYRNNNIFSEQGNRNPFIDYYDYDIASIIFANGDPEVAD